jgi:hypothetical protein
MPPPPLSRAPLARPLPLRRLHRSRLRLHLGARRTFTATRPTPARPSPAGRSKPAVLGQPDKFRPPSHPARRPAARHRKRLYYGPQTSSEQKATFDSKQYPYSFPPRKTFMHWFLTTRSIHIWISLVRSSPPSSFPPPKMLTTENRAASSASAPSSPTASSTATTATRSSSRRAGSC